MLCEIVTECNELLAKSVLEEIMARGALSENERHCLDTNGKQQIDRLQDAEKTNGDFKPNGLRVRFVDEEGKTERLMSADEVDCAVSHVKKIHILKNRSSSETSILLRNPSLMKRRSSSDRRLSDGNMENINNNSLSENLNGKPKYVYDKNKTENGDVTKDVAHYKKNCNVYSVNQAKTLTPEKKKAPAMALPKLISSKVIENGQGKSTLPAEVCLAEAAFGKDFTARAIGRLSRGLGRLLRRTNSVRISEPDPVYKVAYLGNVLTGWAKGENCIEKPLATLWRNYQQTTKPDVIMKLSVTNSGLKGFTKEHGLTEYWSHRVTYCASPPHYPKLFCWVYRHEGKKLKHELRCHAVLCTKESVSKRITEELQVKLKQALVEFKKDRISKQNARLSLANSVYDNPSMPRRKIMLSVGAMNYRPPLERSKSAPKLGAIEELCSEEDEEEAELQDKDPCNTCIEDNEEHMCTQTLDRRRPEIKSPRKMSCPGYIRSVSDSDDISNTEDILKLLEEHSKKTALEASHDEEDRLGQLESIEESNEASDIVTSLDERKILSNYLITDSDDGSVSSGCETSSTVNSDTEPTSLPTHFSSDDKKTEQTIHSVIERIHEFEKPLRNDSPNPLQNDQLNNDEVNHIPIGERNAFRRRSTYPPVKDDVDFEDKYDSMIDNYNDFHSLNANLESEVFKNSGDNESACSDESGYSESLENGKDSVVGNTIMV